MNTSNPSLSRTVSQSTQKDEPAVYHWQTSPIEPDYQLALGQMPTEEVAELRLLFEDNFPPRSFAEILGVAETTKLAIRARVATALSVTEYDAMAAPLSGRLRRYVSDDSNPWPVPAATLARRLGEGSWDQALPTVGLSMHAAADRFGEDDFFRALRDYTGECRSFEFPLSLQTYDRWVIAEVALGRERPSAVELIDRYGSWDVALRAVLEPESAQGQNQPAIAIPDSDDEPLSSPRIQLMKQPGCERENTFADCSHGYPEEDPSLLNMTGPEPGPFDMHARGARLKEFGSEQFQANGAAPVSSDHLHYEDRAEPDVDSAHWRKQEMPFHDSGHQILDALRYGWRASTLCQRRWSTLQPISGQGRDNGVTTEDALAGDIQSLRNAV